MGPSDPSRRSPEIDQLGDTVFGGARVAMLHCDRVDDAHAVWALTLLEFDGSPVARREFHMAADGRAPITDAEAYLLSMGAVVAGGWMSSPDLAWPRRYARVTVPGRLE